MNIELPATPRVSDERRVGFYTSDTDIVGLLWYGQHTIFQVRPDGATTMGRAPDRDIVIDRAEVSIYHCVLTRGPNGLTVLNDASTNGLAYEVGREHGLALRPSFTWRQDAGGGFVLNPGMTFAISSVKGEPYRFIGIDAAMRSAHPGLIEILGREEEVRFSNGEIETPTPSDLLLAADSPGHILITGPRGCEQGKLARMIHDVSKRRSGPFVYPAKPPDDRESQAAVLKDEATAGTLVIDLSTVEDELDPTFVSQMFSPEYQLRVIAIARTRNQARKALGDRYSRPLMHIELCPVAKRKAAIKRLLDQWLKERNSTLSIYDLTETNQKALLRHEWRDNLTALRDTAVKLDEIAASGFARAQAAEKLGMFRQSLDRWYSETMGFEPELVTPQAKAGILAKVEERQHAAGPPPSPHSDLQA